MGVKTIIIDDESAFHQSLKNLLADRARELELIGFARSVQEGLALIQELKPQLIFLDIKLPDGSGFDILRQLKRYDFNVIFTTAYDQYALEAFHFSAVDYLMKPIDPEELWSALDKVLERVEKEQNTDQISVLMDNLDESSQARKKIVLRDIESMHILKLDQIEYCTAQGSYTYFHLTDGRKLVISQSLKEFESLLGSNGFLRIHRSHVINVNKIIRLDKAEGGVVIMETGAELPVSMRKKEILMQYFDQLL